LFPLHGAHGVSTLAHSAQRLIPRTPKEARLLLVDDSPTNRRILRDVLSKYVEDVQVAESAEIALALMRDKPTPASR